MFKNASSIPVYCIDVYALPKAVVMVYNNVLVDIPLCIIICLLKLNVDKFVSTFHITCKLTITDIDSTKK